MGEVSPPTWQKGLNVLGSLRHVIGRLWRVSLTGVQEIVSKTILQPEAKFLVDYAKVGISLVEASGWQERKAISL